MKRLAILGSTGSIGVNTLDIVRQFPEQFKVIGLSAGLNTQLLKQQILQFRPKIVSVLNKELSETLRRELSSVPVEIVHGVEGLIQVATHPEVDQVVSAHCRRGRPHPDPLRHQDRKNHCPGQQRISGHGRKDRDGRGKAKPGSDPAGGQRTQRHLPVLARPPKGGCPSAHPDRIGRPFPQPSLRETSGGDGQRSPSAIPHWEMGKKITIDSASLMNKGFEVIEAHWLFDIPVEKIVVHIHPQSVVHSMVEYIDGSIVAQMGITDMRVPISYALSFPRTASPRTSRVWTSFRKEGSPSCLPDPERFPCLEVGLSVDRDRRNHACHPQCGQ